MILTLLIIILILLIVINKQTKKIEFESKLSTDLMRISNKFSKRCNILDKEVRQLRKRLQCNKDFFDGLLKENNYNIKKLKKEVKKGKAKLKDTIDSFSDFLIDYRGDKQNE